jgi:hypothetical protein
MRQGNPQGRSLAIACRVIALVVLALSAGCVRAAVSCVPTETAGVERCVAGLLPATAQRIYEPQEASNWCWAATVTMLLRRYGVDIAQKQVVRAQLGRTDNVPVNADAISELLTRNWDDDAGRHASASATLLPPWRRALGLAAPEVLDDLAQGRPLVLQTRDHAMVLVQVMYERRSDGGSIAPAGVRVLGAAVLDPASGLRLRTLDASDRPEYLARVRVDVRAPRTQLAAWAPVGRSAQ